MAHKEQVVTVPNITAPGTVEASFVDAPVVVHEWVLSAGVGGSIDPSGVVMVDDGGQLVFTVRADAGKVIDKILVNGEDVALHV